MSVERMTVAQMSVLEALNAGLCADELEIDKTSCSNLDAVPDFLNRRTFLDPRARLENVLGGRCIVLALAESG